MSPRIGAAHETDIPQLLSLNNRYAASGLTLARTPEFAANHLSDYRVLRDQSGAILGCIALDEYSPSVAEIISLAVDEDAHGLGHGRQLIRAAVTLAERRGYTELFAVSFSDVKVDRTEIEVGEKHCFARKLGE
jgi:N-acetylglutamate synthase-like GNAT family acetyltransferase